MAHDDRTPVLELLNARLGELAEDTERPAVTR